MLQRLHIQNYAIIDQIELELTPGLNIITGETGAGKSILVGALSLVLGERADSAALMNRAKKCVVEAFFTNITADSIKNFLAEHDLDAEAELVIRREIAVNGKSRAFVNDTPVNLEHLRHLSLLLADLHQQFDTLSLSDSAFQRDVIDALAGNNPSLQRYQLLYHRWQQSQQQLRELQMRKEQFNATYDYNKFLFDELEEAAFSENEVEHLDTELKLLSNAEAIRSALSAATYALNEGEQPLVAQLKKLQQQLQPYSAYHAILPSIVERIHSVQVELADVADEIERLNDQVQYDPKRIELVSDRMAVGYKLFKKHGVKDTSALLALQSQLAEKLTAVLNIDEAIAKEQKQTDKLLSDLTTLAAELFKNRKKQLKPFEEKVNTLLAQVGMPNAKLKAECQETGSLNEFGADKIDFLFDANKSGRFETIRKVASGGELSRLMLCIKSLVAKSLDLPTLIFDEIDTGISGEAAKQVGIIMKSLATGRQLISITHQPQIAGRADAHFFVYKEIQGDAIRTNIRLLNHEERITTIARMLGGEKPTAAALQNAREMLN